MQGSGSQGTEQASQGRGGSVNFANARSGGG
jgi:hypothetical protein